MSSASAAAAWALSWACAVRAATKSKTLQVLGSEQSLKNVALGMVTAGALNGLVTALKLDAVTPQMSGFTANLGKNIINNVASATMNSALTGGNLEKKSALIFQIRPWRAIATSKAVPQPKAVQVTMAGI
ncbi:DUF637 domain-containing protein [Amphibiibacter pelophylacis]|uniref:DUF637 domain-containing protein n=1 Tax=Amphibiibacter pelophylacis TaxID=1799477 RepID=A0ACC6P0N5_9BURK